MDVKCFAHGASPLSMLKIITKKIIERTRKHKRKKREGRIEKKDGQEGWKEGRMVTLTMSAVFSCLKSCSKGSEMLLRTNLYKWQGSICYLK